MKQAITSVRKTSFMAGVLYLLTFVSIPTLVLYRSIHEPGYISGQGSDTNVIIGGLLEIIVAITGIGTAVVLYPVLKRQNQSAALGLVASRVLEATTIFLGVAFLLALVTLRQRGAGVDSRYTAQALVALYDRIFLLGQGFIPAINDLLLGYLLYKSGLVPKALAVIGMMGALPLITGYLLVMFGVVDRISPVAALSALPVAVFECSLGIYFTIKGFKASPIIKQ